MKVVIHEATVKACDETAYLDRTGGEVRIRLRTNDGYILIDTNGKLRAFNSKLERNVCMSDQKRFRGKITLDFSE